MKVNSKKGSIGFKLTALLIVLTVLIGVIIIFTLRVFWREALINTYSENAQYSTRFIATLIDGDELERYIESGEKNDYNDELLGMMSDMKREFDISYLYIFKPDKDHFTYIVEAMTENDDPAYISQYGDIYEYSDTEYTYLIPDVIAQTPSTQVVLAEDTGFGQGVSAWAPIFNSDGELVAMIEADYSIADVLADINFYTLVTLGIVLTTIIILLIPMLKIVNSFFVHPIEKLTLVMSAYDADKRTEKPELIKTNDEIECLSEAFANMTEDINLYIDNIQQITADKERIAAELNVATTIQTSMLPCIFPAFPEREEFDIYATMQPAKEVGGDFYDFFLINETHLGIVIADVSGKGVPAALFMVIAKTLIKNHAQSGKSPEEVFDTVNAQLCENNEAGMFVTAFMGVLNLETGELVFANAGHNPPLIKKKDGKYEWLKTKPGFVLAGLEGVKYMRREITIESGDTLFLYTDGVTEALNPEKQLYSDERLNITLNEIDGNAELKDILRTVKKDIDSFANGENQADDITMLVMKYNGKDDKKIAGN